MRRSFLISSLAVLAVLTSGCGSELIDDTTYRRLEDRFDSFDHCLSDGDFARCYQTLTFCADGRAMANVAFPERGPYRVEDTHAIAELLTMTLVFDLETASSPQLPGRHRWEIVEPLHHECD